MHRWNITVQCLTCHSVSVKSRWIFTRMNQVQLLKSRFENLNNSEIESLDIAVIRAKSEPPIKFSRSSTCIDFSKIRKEETPKDPSPEKKPFQRQSSNSSNSSYKSIRRSPAFRFDAQARPTVKSVAKTGPKDEPEKKKLDFDEQEYFNSSATIRKALLKPLPTGNPPKKPPRTFMSPVFPKKSDREAPLKPIQNRVQQLKISPNTLPKKTTKTEDKKGISNFLNCIISPCSIDPIYYEQIKRERPLFRAPEESIYMEPFAHLKEGFNSSSNNNSSDVTTPEDLHYMCTVLDPPPPDANGNLSSDEQRDPKRSSLEATELEDYEKVSVKC